MRDWVRMTSLSTSLRWSSGRSRVDSTSRLVRIAVSGVRSSWEDTAAKSRADASASLVRFCSFQMRCSMPRIASAISMASLAPCTSTRGASSPASMDRVCSASCLNGRTANAANSQANTAAAPMAKVQISSTRRCRLLVSATVASYVAPTATDVGSGPGISTVRTR
ncbi:Uncharacterised protein [Mycobacterium tuberculosis]|uniref:Uncharacterized protein n=2 Tax=Mycobacterium tuberculosis TaxID=1773 RepID=A0A655F522_MYCTX|nr:Uncharacterised protein [Mycobacterium tuberculosis]CNV53580.1 Uncharacterised protein [Mycobacterium tuberculosis]COX01644.1 Uncharacterised protein [Mycobacterium tuberculosis]